MNYSKQCCTANKYLFAWIALFIIPLSGICVDIYVPSLPAISEYFAVHKSLAQLTVTFYMAGIGLMQLFAGAITDAYGRKKPFFWTISIFIIVSLAIPFVNSIDYFLFFRLIQGIAVGMIVVAIRSVIPDLFEGKELYKMATYMTVAWSIGPIIAPAIGGHLQHYFNWKANFYFLTVYGVIAFLLVWLVLPETSKHYYALEIKAIYTRSRQILTNKNYVSGLMINGLLYSMIMIFAVVAPFLIENQLHYSAEKYGWIALAAGFFWFCGTMMNRLLLNISVNLKVPFCLWVMLIIAVLMAYFAWSMPMDLVNIIVPVFLLLFLGGIVFPNYFALAMSLFPTMTGSANALFGGSLFIISGAGSALATFLKASNQLPLSLAFLTIFVMCLWMFFMNQKYLKD